MIQPVILPNSEEVAAAKARVQCDDGPFHLAVAGVIGNGRSSLTSAFYGPPNNYRNVTIQHWSLS